MERAAWTLHDAGCAPVVVVLGAAADRVTGQTDLSKTTVVVNRAWGTGLSSSVRAGLRCVEDAEVEAVVVIPVDMPGITTEAVRRVADLPYREALVCATYEGRRGEPVLLGRAHWPGVMTLASGDVGLRPYLLAHSAQLTEVPCDGIATGDDIDTAEDAARLGIQVPP